MDAMATKFLAGDRIIVSPHYHWAKNVTGTVGAPPSQVVALSGPWQNNLTRDVQTRLGKAVFYWVWFDEPQVDAEGDGPYQGGEIREDVLTLVSRNKN
jgi:hypothetical protein